MCSLLVKVLFVSIRTSPSLLSGQVVCIGTFNKRLNAAHHNLGLILKWTLVAN